MASIIKRGPHQYQAQIRRGGYPTQTKTFETRADAEAWAASVELDMRRGRFLDRTEAEKTSLSEVLERYLAEVTPLKRGARQEQYRIRQLMRTPLALRKIADLRGVDFSRYRDERLRKVGPKTVRLELATFSAVLTYAHREWGMPIAENPVAAIKKPTPPRGRSRRLEGNEEERLLAAAREARSATLELCIILAIETGMRRGEIAGLTWEQVDFPENLIRLSMTKNGEPRTVPLTQRAEDALKALPRPIHGGRLTQFHDSNGLGAAFRRACERAKILDLHFHDLRHEAASRLAPNMPVATLAKVMGWRNIQMAMLYYNPSDAELVAAVRKGGMIAPTSPEPTDRQAA